MRAEPDNPAIAGAESGFSLLEFIAALMLLALVLPLCGTAIRMVSASWYRSTSFAGTQDMVLRGGSAFRRDVERLQRIVVGDGANRRFVFDGDSDHVSFAAAEPAYPTEPGLFLIRYSVSSAGSTQVLLRSRSPLDPVAPLDARMFGAGPLDEPAVAFEGAFTYRFSYAEAETAAWQSRWSEPRRLPGLIRLEIVNTGTGELLAPPIVVRPRIDAELSCVTATSTTCSTRNKGELGQPASKPAESAADPRAARDRG